MQNEVYNYTHDTVTEEQQKIGREGIDREKIQPGGKHTVEGADIGHSSKSN